MSPKYALAYAYRAGVYFNQNNFNQAVTDASLSIELDPTQALAYVTRGMSYASLGNVKSKQDIDLAIANATQLLAKQPKNAQTYYFRALAYLSTGKRGDQATADIIIADCNQSIAANPLYSPAYNLRGGVYMVIKKYKQAREDWNKVIEIDPNSVMASAAASNIKLLGKKGK